MSQNSDERQDFHFNPELVKLKPELGNVYDENKIKENEKEWEIEGLSAENLPYLLDVKGWANMWPNLRYLANFMEVSTVPSRWLELRSNPPTAEPTEARKLRWAKTNVVRLSYHKADGLPVDDKRFKTSEELRAGLEEPVGAGVSMVMYVVEDLSRDVIDALGSKFDVDPSFFGAHIADYAWYNTRDRFRTVFDLDIDNLQRNWLSLRYMSARYFSHPDDFKAAVEEVGGYNVYRRADNDHQNKSIFDDREAVTALKRSRLGIWLKPRSERRASSVFVRTPTPSRRTTARSSRQNSRRATGQSVEEASGGAEQRLKGEASDAADRKPDGDTSRVIFEEPESEEQVDEGAAIDQTTSREEAANPEAANTEEVANVDEEADGLTDHATVIVLLDPTMTKGSPLWNDKGTFTCTARAKSHEAHGYPNTAQNRRPQSTFEEFVFWAKQRAVLLDTDGNGFPDQPLENLPLEIVIRIICARWQVIIDYANTRLNQIDWQIAFPDQFIQNPKDEDGPLKQLHLWRRVLPLYREMLTTAIDRIFESPCVEKWLAQSFQFQNQTPLSQHPQKSEDRIHAFKKDMNRLLDRLDEHQKRIDRLSSVVQAQISIMDSRRGLQESRDVGRLTWLATAFIPLSLIASMFSMQADISSSRETFGWFFAASLPTVAILMFLMWLTTRARVRIGTRKWWDFLRGRGERGVEGDGRGR